MPVKYIPYVPNTIEGQAILDNFTRTRRVLRYRDNGKVFDHLRRGLPLYEDRTKWKRSVIPRGCPIIGGGRVPPETSSCAASAFPPAPT